MSMDPFTPMTFDNQYFRNLQTGKGLLPSDQVLYRRRLGPERRAVFSFLYFLKIKISKIYVRFEIFQKYPPVAPHRATGPKCNFFLQIRNEVPGKKSHVAPHRATGACRPPLGRQGPVARWGGDRVPSPYIYKPWPAYAAIPFVI